MRGLQGDTRRGNIKSMNKEQDIRKIIGCLEDDNWWARKNAIETLVAYPKELYLHIIEEWLRRDDNALLRNTAMEIYRALGEGALEALIPMLKDADSDIRIFAANLLGDIKTEAALYALLPALRDPYENVRAAAAESLGKIGNVKAIEALIDAINDTPWVASACIEAIGEIGGEKALSFLYKCLEKEEFHGMTFFALEKTGDRQFIRHLTPFVDKQDDLRELALKAIVNIADREGIKPMNSYFIGLMPLLLELQKSARPDIKRAAFIALTWSEEVTGLPYYIDALNDEDLQEYAIKGIVALGKKSVPGIVEAIQNKKSNRAVLTKTLSMLGESHALLRFADDEDAEVRTEVALAIGSLKTEKAQKVLLKLELDSEPEVRAAAQLSLKKSDTKK